MLFHLGTLLVAQAQFLYNLTHFHTNHTHFCLYLKMEFELWMDFHLTFNLAELRVADNVVEFSVRYST